jgi:serine/threonine protein phosphatase 1
MLELLLPPWKKGSAKVPNGIRIYAVGDIHGRADLLDEVLSRIDDHLGAYPTQRAIKVFLGDYIDRGQASRAVLDRLIRLVETQELILLKGNHESFLIEFLNDADVLDSWRNFGGFETLLSYGLTPRLKVDLAEKSDLAVALKRAMPPSHQRFLQALVKSFTCGDFFFAHAGVRPGIPLGEQREADLLWIRHDFLSCQENFGKIIIHGHTPVLKPEVHLNRINIDTGAYATGQLTCLVLEGDELLLI